MLPVHLLLQNRYRILHLIGRGGMGAVYEATDQRLGHSVAIKQIIHGEAQAFEREARLLARLRHPALPIVSDYFVEDEGHFLVMGLISGDDLATTLLRRQQPFSLAEVTLWASQLLDALTFLHSQTPPILHRDIKPANLKLTPDGSLMLLDFGLAKGKLGETSELQKSAAGYTLCYAAPEQIRGEGTDARSDLYAVAATFYHLLTGSQPPDALQRALRLAAGNPDPVLTADPQTTTLPQSLLLVLQKAMALDPAERFTNAQALHHALQTAITGQTVVAAQQHEPTPSRPSSHGAPPHNLPTQLTPLIGREQEIGQIQSLFQRGDVRLVTLTGAGGSGKTRLALAIAQAFVDTTPNPQSKIENPKFPDGIFLVNFAPIRDPDLLISTIAQVVGVKEVSGQSLQITLQEYLRAKQMLLILDNFEQIISAVLLVSELLTTCPALKMLVTSREVLRLRGEHEFLVPLLAVPDLTPTLSAESVAYFSAVQLFMQRAQAVRPNFVLDDTNAHTVAEICVRLDGLPLALELAAARVKVLTPQAILARLGDRFALLSGGARDLPDRQRTLRSTIDWSYDLLTEDEKILFRRLAVFVGGCTLEAVEQVCNPPDDENMPRLQIDVLDGLASLMDKSLLRQEIGLDGEIRFVMLVTIHEYATVRLVESRDLETLQRRHITYYLTLAEEAETKLTGAEQSKWFNILESEYDNLRSALTWSKQSDSESFLRISSALWRFWENRSRVSEAYNLLQGNLAKHNQKVPLSVYAKALFVTANLASDLGDYDHANPLYQQSLDLYQQLEEWTGVANALNGLGRTTYYQGRYDLANTYYLDALSQWQTLGEKRGMAVALANLASMASSQENHTLALTYYEQCLPLLKEVGDLSYVAYALGNMGSIAWYQGQYGLAQFYYEQSYELHQELGNSWGIGYARRGLGNIACKQGNYAMARACYKETLQIQQEWGDKNEIIDTLRAFANLALAEQAAKRAVQFFAAADALSTAIGAPILPVESASQEQSLSIVKAELGEETFNIMWAAGHAMTLEQAIEYALTVI